MDESDLSVGTPEYPIKSVALVLHKSPIIRNNLINFVKGLETPKTRTEKFKQDVQRQKITEYDLLTDALQLWVGRNGSEATLGKLFQVLGKGFKGGADDIEESIRLEFNLSCRNAINNPSISWSELSPLFQQRVKRNLGQLSPTLVFEELLPILKGSILNNLMTGNNGNIFKQTLPASLSYYVNRTIYSRCIISNEILSKHVPDVFLLTGIDLYQLISLAGTQAVRHSSEQMKVQKLTVRFIILENVQDFEHICQKTDMHVHWLHYENGKLQWIKSRGEMDTLQKYISTSQLEQEEEDFCLNLKSDSTQSNQPVCISDTPGMGKSVLLAQIGRRLAKQFPDKIIIFLVFSEFISQLRQSPYKNRMSAFEQTLMDLASNNELGKAVLKSKLTSVDDDITIELLLDGLDEVNSTDIDLAYELLQAIRTSCKSIRLWVTSRPHLQTELESRLSVLGYTIRPFDEENQLRFLTSFWSPDKANDDYNHARLKAFAKNSLQLLKSRINSKDQDIAGVPLLCLLIGEVYEQEAISFAKSEQAPALPSVLINSITDLYKTLIITKFQKYLSVHVRQDFHGIDTLMDMHVRLSLELIFPEQFSRLEHLLGQIKMEEVLKVGIVELTDKTNIAGVRFLHRTFAEYFIAWFIVDRLVSGVGWVDNLTDFIINDVLKVGDKVRLNFNHAPRDLKFQGFVYQVINYFIDSTIADKHQIIPTEVIQSICEKASQFEATAKTIIYACAFGDHVNILKLFSEIKAFHFDASTIFTVDLLLLAIFNSGLELVKITLDQYETCQELTLNVNIRILNAIVEGGNFYTLEFFIKEKGFREIVEYSLNRGVKPLLHDCVQNTDKNSKPVIDQRIQVMHMLVGINRDMLEQETNYILATLNSTLHVHHRLIIELVHLGLNVLAVSVSGYTIIHRTDYISDKNYHSILTCIGEERLRKLVQMRTYEGDTPLMCVVKSMNPLPETFNLFNKVGADFNDLDNHHESIMSIAIRYGRHADTFRNLIKHGSDVNWENNEGYTLLHVAAKYGNLDAVKVLLQEHQMNVNAKTHAGYTPMDCALMSFENSTSRSVTALFLEENGAKFNESINSEGQSLLHVAVKKGNETSVRLLLHLKLNINAVDYYGNTPLHYVTDLSLTQFLLDNKANPNAENKLGEKPFHTALKNKNLDHGILRFLKSKTDVKWSACLAKLYLFSTLEDRSHTIDDELNSFSQDCAADGVELEWNYRHSNGDTLLHLAARSSNLSAIRYLTQEKKVDIASTNTRQQTVLHITSKLVLNSSYSFEIVKYLIENGVNVFAVDDKNRTFMHFCILKVSSFYDAPIRELFEYLIERKCYSLFEVKGCVDECTPLQLAIYRGFIKDKSSLTVLQEGGVNFNILDKKGRNVLSYAIRGTRDTKILSNLIDCGADWKIKDSSGCNLLYISAKKNNIDSLKFFFSFGELEINGADNDGNTPLHCAVQKKEVFFIKQLARLLVEKGSDSNIRNKDGDTPLSLVLKRGHRYDSELLQILGGLSASQEGELTTESESDYSSSSASACLRYEDSDDNDERACQLGESIVNKFFGNEW